MIGYKAAGEAIFGKKTATTVEDMNIEAVADILENWMEVPINVHAIIEYDMIKGKTRGRRLGLVHFLGRVDGVAHEHGRNWIPGSNSVGTAT